MTWREFVCRKTVFITRGKIYLYILASEDLFQKKPIFIKYLCGNYIVFIYALMHQSRPVCKSLAQAAEEYFARVDLAKTI